ncbi:enoyl-CoA hydratase/isomerase family protein [Candidatus Woesearchaeota archaeon]|nr:enoyl-CoA hydratase/isomerase family protein [Candidatus Woesearchaeota archaeon]
MNSVTVAKKGSVAIVTLNRPDKLNALNTKLLRSLKRTLFLLNCDKKVKAIILTGAGKAFSAGADISEMYGFSFRDAYEFSKLGQAIGWLLKMSEKITIAAINGYAIGGGLEIALAADLRVCKNDAKLGLPEAKIGLIPGFGGTQALQEVAGPADAKKMVEQGMILDAKDAHKLGVADVLTKHDPVQESLKLLKKVKTKDAVDALSCSRRSTRRSPDLPRNHIDERSRFAGKFELQKTKLLMKRFLEERKIKIARDVAEKQ